MISFDSTHWRFVYYSWYTVVRCIERIFFFKIILLYIMIRDIFDVEERKKKRNCV